MSEHNALPRRDVLRWAGAGGLALSVAPVGLPKAHAGGVDYYVDNGAPGGGTDPTSPWTLEQASGYEFGPGDTIHFRKGRTFEGGFVLKGVGTASAPITVRGDDWGDREAPNAVIDGGDQHAITNATAWRSGYLTYYNPTAWNHVSDWRFVGLELKSSLSNPLNRDGRSQFNGSNGIYVVADGNFRADNIYIDRVRVSQATGFGVLLLSMATGAFDHVFKNVKILNSTFHDSTDHVSDPDHPGMIDGIRLVHYALDPSQIVRLYERSNFDTVTIRNNVVANTLWDGIGVYSCRNVSIEGNYIDAAGQMPHPPDGGAYWGSGSYGLRTTFAEKIVIQRNRIRNQGNSGADGDGGSMAIENGSRDVLAQYNTTSGAAGHCIIAGGSFSNGEANGSTSNIVFRFNFLHHEGVYVVDTNECGPGSAGCSPSDPVSITANNRIHNNTIILTGTTINWSRAAISFQLSKAGSSGNVVANNIVFINNLDPEIPFIRSYYSNLNERVTFESNQYWSLSGASAAKFSLDILSEPRTLDFSQWQSYVDGAGEQIGDPLLVDPTSAPVVMGGAGDIHLRKGSPAVNAGRSIAPWLRPGEQVGGLKGYYPDGGSLNDRKMDIGAAVAR